MAITIDCQESAQGAYQVTCNGYTLWVKDIYKGCVLRKWEHNGYDDSDFYADVWDEAEQRVKSIEYATTRFWTYHLGAVVDATPEARGCAEAWEKAKRRAEKAKGLLEYRAKMRETARINGLKSYTILFQLKAYPEIIQLLSKKRKSKFYQDLRNQVVAWLLSSERKYDCPLSPRQRQAICTIDQPRRRF